MAVVKQWWIDAVFVVTLFGLVVTVAKGFDIPSAGGGL